jgi:transposase
VGISSLKRYVATYREGRSLAPKKPPGSKPKLGEGARKLLEANLEEHPEMTLPQRSEFLRRVCGVSGKRLHGFQDAQAHGLEQKKRSVGASEGEEYLRAAWRALWWPEVWRRSGWCVRGGDGHQHLAGTPVCLVETGRTGTCERAAQLGGERHTLLASMSAEGMGVREQGGRRLDHEGGLRGLGSGAGIGALA